MENPIHVDDSNNTSPSDDDDKRLFKGLGHKLTNKILRIKHNDPEVKSLILRQYFNLDESAWDRLGHIIGTNTHVKELRLFLVNMAVLSGLQSNRCIEKVDLSGINLGDLGLLAPFLNLNPNLKVIDLSADGIDNAGIEIISNALSNRTEDTVERLNLRLSDFDLEVLVETLSRITKLKRLDLSGGDGIRGSASLARLLGDQESNLEELNLTLIEFHDDSVIKIVDSLQY